MVDISSLFIAQAWASADAALPPPQDAQSALMRFFPLFAILAIFYFLMIRPQQKQIRDQSAMLKALERGNKVYLSSGFVGVVHKIDENNPTSLWVEIAPGVVVEVLKNTVTGLYANLGIEAVAPKK